MKAKVVDTDERRRLFELIRKLNAGLMNGEDFVNNYCSKMHTKDKSVLAISNLIWTVYDPDFPKNRKCVDRKMLARIVLFLHTDLHYSWIDDDLRDLLLELVNRLSFKLFSKYIDKLKSPPYYDQGDISIFPFKNQNDFDEAKKIRIMGKRGAVDKV